MVPTSSSGRLFIGPVEEQVLKWIEQKGGVVSPRETVLGLLSEKIVKYENQCYEILKNLRQKGMLEFQNGTKELVLKYRSDKTPYDPNPASEIPYDDEWTDEYEELYQLLDERRHVVLTKRLEHGMDNDEVFNFRENLQRLLQGQGNENLKYMLFLQVMEKLKPPQHDALAQILGLSESEQKRMETEFEKFRRLKKKLPESFEKKLDEILS